MNVSIDLGSYLVVSSFLVLHLWGFIYQVTYMYALFRSTLILPSTVKSLHRFDISSAKDSYIVICLVSKGCRPEQVHSTSRTASISTSPTPPHHHIYNQQKTHKRFSTQTTSQYLISNPQTKLTQAPKSPSPANSLQWTLFSPSLLPLPPPSIHSLPVPYPNHHTTT